MITLLIIITISVILVFNLRLYNKHKHENDNTLTTSYYNNAMDVSLYPRNIEGVNVKYVDEGRCQGFHLIPEKKTYEGIVICYGGSEGSPNFYEAQRLAK